LPEKKRGINTILTLAKMLITIDVFQSSGWTRLECRNGATGLNHFCFAHAKSAQIMLKQSSVYSPSAGA